MQPYLIVQDVFEIFISYFIFMVCLVSHLAPKLVKFNVAVLTDVLGVRTESRPSLQVDMLWCAWAKVKLGLHLERGT